MATPEERYQKAIEFTKVVRELWDSYPHEALLVDRETGQFANRELVHAIHHEGEHFHVKGPLNVPAFGAKIPLFQAGASNTGRSFAASIAHAIFAATPDRAAGIELRNDLRNRAAQLGRQPDDIRVLPGMYFFLGRTHREARDLHKEAHAHLTNERRYAAVQSTLGMDLSDLPLDAKVTAEMLPDAAAPVRSRTHAELLRKLISQKQPTVEELLSRPEVVGSAHWVVVGTPEEALQEIIAWQEAGALDGFIALPGGSVESMNLFFDELMPMLAEAGRFRKEYTGSTLGEHLGMSL